MKNIVFLSLLVGLTACNLTSLRVVEDAPAGGDISGDINLPTVEVPNSARPINNPMEFTNRAALAQFNVDVTDLTQYNSNVIATDNIGSYNWYFDNTTAPSRVVNTQTGISVPINTLLSQFVTTYTATVLPDNRFASYVVGNASVNTPVELPNGGMFLQLRRTLGYNRIYISPGVISDWGESLGDATTIIWVKFFGDFVWVAGGTVNSADSSKFIFSQNPINVPAFTSR